MIVEQWGFRLAGSAWTDQSPSLLTYDTWGQKPLAHLDTSARAFQGGLSWVYAILFCLIWFFTSHQLSFSYKGTGLPGLTSTKLLAQGHNAVTPVMPLSLRQALSHWATALPVYAICLIDFVRFIIRKKYKCELKCRCKCLLMLSAAFFLFNNLTCIQTE